jgi:hypothetical protein
MSLAQAFQTAAAYRQATIDQNQQAAMQTPMLAVQALSVGLQAQAQQQDMQFKMQSMVLQTQLQIEETKTKQAMQLMEFDLKSRQFNANEQIARKQLEFERQRTDASVAASDLQRSVAKAQLDREMGLQVADTALSQLRSVYTNRQIYSGAADQDIQMLGEKNPVAANLLREKLIAEKRGEAAPVLSQIDQLERLRADRLREDTRGMTFREATIARQRINSDFDAALAPLREDATLLTGRNLVAPSQTSLSDLFGARSLLTPAESIDAFKALTAAEANIDPANTAAMSAVQAQKNALLKGLGLPVTGEDPLTPAKPAGVTDIMGGTAPMTTDITKANPAQDIRGKQTKKLDTRVEGERAAASESAGAASVLLKRAYDAATDAGDLRRAMRYQQMQTILKTADEATKLGKPVRPVFEGNLASGFMGAPVGSMTPGEARQIKAIAEEATRNGDLDGAIQKIDAILKKLELPL